MTKKSDLDCKPQLSSNVRQILSVCPLHLFLFHVTLMPLLAHRVTAAKQGWSLLFVCSYELPEGLPEESYAWWSGLAWSCYKVLSEQQPSSAHCPGRCVGPDAALSEGQRKNGWQPWDRQRFSAKLENWQGWRRFTHTETHAQVTFWSAKLSCISVSGHPEYRYLLLLSTYWSR